MILDHAIELMIEVLAAHMAYTPNTLRREVRRYYLLDKTDKKFSKRVLDIFKAMLKEGRIIQRSRIVLPRWGRC